MAPCPPKTRTDEARASFDLPASSTPSALRRTDRALVAHKAAVRATREAEAKLEQTRRALMVSQAADALEELAKISTTEHFQAVIGKLEQALVSARNEAKGQPA